MSDETRNPLQCNMRESDMVEITTTRGRKVRTVRTNNEVAIEAFTMMACRGEFTRFVMREVAR